MRLASVAPILLTAACSAHNELPRLQRSPASAPDRGPSVQLYAAPIPKIGWLAVHTWFVVQRSEAHQPERWEVWQRAGGRYGHVRKDLQGPLSDVGAGGVFLVAEVRGPRAEAIGALIQSASPHYPCRERYHYFPGPNCNTYTRWILEVAGWEVDLPTRALGESFAVRCLGPG